MISALHDLSMIHNDDLVCVLDGRKTVGDNQAGTLIHKFRHGILNAHFGSGVHRGGSLVQNQDTWF